jgi:carbamoyl-phosphate synthase large subunit
MSKVTDVPMNDIAVNAILGTSIIAQGYEPGLQNATKIICVKVPVFSFQKLNGLDPALAPEMKSTGEVLGLDYVYEKALVKGFIAAGYRFPETRGDVLLSLSDHSKLQGIEIAKFLIHLGFTIIATPGTHRFLRQQNIESREIGNLGNAEKFQACAKEKQIAFIVNTRTASSGTQHAGTERKGFLMRTAAERYSVPCFTSLDTAAAYLEALDFYAKNPVLEYRCMSEMKN